MAPSHPYSIEDCFTITDPTPERNAACPIDPNWGRYVLRVPKRETTTAGGIHLPDIAANKETSLMIAEVVETPEYDQRFPVGSKVVFNRYKANEIEMNGEKFVLVKGKHIVGRVK